MNNDIDASVGNSMLASGNVKITLIKNGEEIRSITAHNTGTVYICEYIAKALIGEYVIAERPGIIVPFSWVNQADHSRGKTLIGNGSPYTNSKLGVSAGSWDNYTDSSDPNIKDGGFCTSKLTFMIPSAIISGSTIDGFHLLSKDTSRKLYAVVELTNPLDHLEGDTNLKVEWTLFASYKWDIDRTWKKGN